MYGTFDVSGTAEQVAEQLDERFKSGEVLLDDGVAAAVKDYAVRAATDHGPIQISGSVNIGFRPLGEAVASAAPAGDAPPTT